MTRSPRLENKIRLEIQQWINTRGTDFISSIKEFCQGNRASLTQVMAMIEELGTKVFVGEGEALNKDLLEKLEYGVFDLIGKFSSTPAGSGLIKAIQENITEYLTEIFAEAKKQWNLNHYKITASYEELDPNNCTIPAPEQVDAEDIKPERDTDKSTSRRQARQFLDELVLFAKLKLRGEKNRKIAVNWLENPEKQRDYCWLASLTDSSTGSIKVTITRLKQTLARNYSLKLVGDRLILDKSSSYSETNAKRSLNHSYS
ncbi:MAG: hypothetical protein GY839_03990 [candidate division Zixibacteria bacterium]|nr:hypothetical protein [candidate division Zixibacteria bacterium]